MWTAIASLIGAGLAFAGGLIANRKNKEIADQNVAYQKEANTQNIAFQQQENEITRQREDTAVQRAAADMTAAGLSKTLAAGNPASASSLAAPSVSPVNNSFKYESALQKMQIAQFLQDMAVKGEQLKQQKALNDANIEYTKAQTENMNNQNSVFMEQHQHKMELENSQIALNYANKELTDAKIEFEKITNSKQADLIQSEINKNVAVYLLNKSQKDLTDRDIQKKAFEIANEIANYKYLTQKQKELVAEIAYKEMQTKVLQNDLDVAKQFGYPVGYMPSGWIGNAMTTGYGVGNYAQFKFPSSGNLSFSPYERMVLGMSGNVGTYLPPVT